MKTIKYFILAMGLSLGLSAQSDMLLYNFNAIPQSLHTNPAMPQQTKVWIGLPAVSGFSFHYHNSGFSLVDIFEKGTDVNTNLENLSNRLNDQSQLTLNQSMDILGIGFKAGKSFISLGATQQFDFQMDLPYQLFQILFTDAGSITNLDLNKFDLETMVRTNFYVGYQQKFLDERLTVGLRVNYIMAQSHAYIDRMNLSLKNDSTYTLRAQSDILVRTSGPAALDNTNNLDVMSLALPDNSGIGLNLGLHYKINDKMDVSASAIDLGTITYNSNNRDYVSNGEYEFNGVEFDLSDDDFSDNIDNLTDSLEAAFNFQEVDGRTYSRSLMNRYYASFNYHLTPKHSFGLLFHSRRWNGDFYNDYGFNYVGRWSRTFQFTAGYSMINGTMHNIGAGFDLKLGPFQLYLMSDNIFGAVDYAGLQTTNLRLGLNLTFYGRRAKKIEEQEEEKAEAEANDQASLLFKL